MKKEQFNARICPQRRRAALKLARAAGFTNDDLVVAALSAIIGTEDKLLNAKREHLQEVAKKLQLSFDQPERQLARLAA